MPTITGASPWPAALNAFQDQFFRGLEADRRNAVVNELNRLRLGEAQAGASARQAATSIVPRILQAPSLPIEMAPAMPPEVVGGESFAGADLQGAAGNPLDMGAMLPVAPAQPSVVQPGLAMSDLMGQLGPEGAAQFGQAYADPTSRVALDAALRSRGVITDEEAEKRRRRATAIQEAKRRMQVSDEAFAAGNPMLGYTQRAAAHRALAEIDDNPAQQMALASEAQKELFRFRERKDQEQQATRELQSLSASIAGYKKQPTIEGAIGIMELAASATTDAGRKRADEIISQAAKGAMNEVKFGPFVQWNALAAQLVEESVAAGKPLPLEVAYRQASQQRPELAAQVVAAFVTADKTIPDVVARGLGLGASGAEIKSVYDEAKAAALGRNLVPGSPEYGRFVTQFVTEQMKNRRAAAGAPLTTNQVLAQAAMQAHPDDPKATPAERQAAAVKRADFVRAYRVVRTQDDEGNWIYMTVPASGSATPVVKPSGDSAPAPKPTERKPTAAETLKGLLEQDKDGAATKPSPTPGATQITAPPKLAATAPEYIAAGRAELQRLIQGGMTKDAAVQAMQKAGWQ